jgi:NitT/TauT family transport system permease protein
MSSIISNNSGTSIDVLPSIRVWRWHFNRRLFSIPASIKRLISYNSLLRLLSLIIFFGGWQILCSIKFEFFIKFGLIPSPVEVFEATIKFLSGAPAVHIKASVTRVLLGFLIAAAAGITLGTLIGWFRKIEGLLLPSLELLRPIPGVAWVPLAILMFPTAETGMVFITFIGAFFPILINTISGVEHYDPLLMRVGQSLGAKRWHIFKDIVIPGALPNIASGLKVGMGNGWFCLITAEILAGRYGIGYLTWESYVTSNYPPIVMGMLLIGLLGALSSRIVGSITSALMPWRVLKKVEQ